MRLQPLVVVVLCGALVALRPSMAAQQAQRPQGVEHPYTAFAPWMETSLRLVTDVSVPGGPTFHVKVYDWVIGARRELPNFPLEGFVTFQLRAGRVETTINGVTVTRQPGEFWVVQPGTKFAIKAKSEGTRGDNQISMRGVVLIRK